MASFTNETFTKHNDYMTPKYAWENIKQFIPKEKMIWEAFYGDGQSGKDLTELGFDNIHKKLDFFDTSKTPVFDLIISNPPFEHTKAVLNHIKELDKPFILIMPSSKINTQYFRNLFSDTKDPIQIIIPRKRIHFIKHVDGKPVEGWKDACNFDCFYYCWKMNLPRDIVWLE